MLATTTHLVELQVQIVKGLVQQERSVLLEQPPALIVLQGSLVWSLLVKTAVQGSTAQLLEQLAMQHALTAVQGSTAQPLELPLAQIAVQGNTAQTLEQPVMLHALTVVQGSTVEPQEQLLALTVAQGSTVEP